MDVTELKEDLLELYRYRSSHWLPDLNSVKTDQAEWMLGPIFTERETYGHDCIYHTNIAEAAGACVATQVSGPTPGLQGIAKIRVQIPGDSDDPSATQPHHGSYRTGVELYNLQTLTASGCTCTPKLLDIGFYQQAEDDPVPSGFIHVIVMERLRGRNLVNFADLPMTERDQVRLAFAKSIREFYSLRFVHDDPHRRNLIWDREGNKCYIIDLEDAREIDEEEEPKFIPEYHFHEWGIAGPEINCSIYGVDPMVPNDGSFVSDLGDDVLKKMASEAAGKGVQPSYKYHKIR